MGQGGDFQNSDDCERAWMLSHDKEIAAGGSWVTKESSAPARAAILMPLSPFEPLYAAPKAARPFSIIS